MILLFAFFEFFFSVSFLIGLFHASLLSWNACVWENRMELFKYFVVHDQFACIVSFEDVTQRSPEESVA